VRVLKNVAVSQLLHGSNNNYELQKQEARESSQLSYQRRIRGVFSHCNLAFRKRSQQQFKLSWKVVSVLVMTYLL
jgi:hypothetical protein